VHIDSILKLFIFLKGDHSSISTTPPANNWTSAIVLPVSQSSGFWYQNSVPHVNTAFITQLSLYRALLISKLQEISAYVFQHPTLLLINVFMMYMHKQLARLLLLSPLKSLSLWKSAMCLAQRTTAPSAMRACMAQMRLPSSGARLVWMPCTRSASCNAHVMYLLLLKCGTDALM
jgi:hypothetical protein